MAQSPKGGRASSFVRNLVTSQKHVLAQLGFKSKGGSCRSTTCKSKKNDENSMPYLDHGL